MLPLSLKVHIPYAEISSVGSTFHECADAAARSLTCIIDLEYHRDGKYDMQYTDTFAG